MTLNARCFQFPSVLIHLLLLGHATHAATIGLNSMYWRDASMNLTQHVHHHGIVLSNLASCPTTLNSHSSAVYRVPKHLWRLGPRNICIVARLITLRKLPPCSKHMSWFHLQRSPHTACPLCGSDERCGQRSNFQVVIVHTLENNPPRVHRFSLRLFAGFQPRCVCVVVVVVGVVWVTGGGRGG